MRIPHAPAAPAGCRPPAREIGCPEPRRQWGCPREDNFPPPAWGHKVGQPPPPALPAGGEDHGPPAPRGRDPATGGGDPWRHGPRVREDADRRGHTAPRKHRLHINTAAPPQVHGLHTNMHAQWTGTAHQRVYNTMHTITCCTPIAAHMHMRTACQHVHTHSLTAHQHTEYDLKLTCTQILHTNAHTRTITLHVSTHTPIYIAHQHQLMCTECTYKSLVQYGKQAHMACTH